MYAEEAAAAYPHAMLHGPAALQRKRKYLRFGTVLTDRPHPDWPGLEERDSIEYLEVTVTRKFFWPRSGCSSILESGPRF